MKNAQNKARNSHTDSIHVSKVGGENKYIPSSIEPKWQEYWVKNKTFSADIEKAKKPFYVLSMFPYPSAEGLHVGSIFTFSGIDVYARFKRMQGYDVFLPMGLDGFGIHSENYALKTGSHPMDQAKKSGVNFYRQLHAIGNSYDWERTLETYDPLYYRWTQWIFIQLFKTGLAYRKAAEVNWCPSCRTVLSDEQVIAGICERCSSTVERRNLEQWFFRITEYAPQLLNNLASMDWTEKVKIAQKQWIGKSEGCLIRFPVAKLDCQISIFTKFPETIYGVTYMVVAPEYEQVSLLVTAEQKEEVDAYIATARAKTTIERTAEDKDISTGSLRAKTGVFTGSYCINPVNNERLPIWVADYVLAGYGTGAVMGVPGSDHRDFAFAKKYHLPIIRVIGSSKEDLSQIKSEKDVLEEGVLVNSGEFTGLKTPFDAREKIKDWITEKGWGKREMNYHLRDWLISRQRYWGAPIPMIYCESCAVQGKSWFLSQAAKVQGSKASKGKNHQPSIVNENSQNMTGWYPVPEDQLPVMLPYIQDYKPLGTGKAPLASHEEFYKTVCPECGGDARRETDVSDTFLDSSWYFLRYPSTDREEVCFDIDITRKWLPVNMYIGGAEHSVLHLLYSRFVTMVLYDLKLLNFEEPFSRFFAHGLIIKDGAKMSKSKGNVVVPDEYITKYGADALRCYLMFLGPFNHGGDFRDTGMEGMYRFLKRVWILLSQKSKVKSQKLDDRSLRMMHKTIKAVTDDITSLSYNTAIARLMEWYNFLIDQISISNEEIDIFIKLLAPFAPHMTEELWMHTRHTSQVTRQTYQSVHLSSWPSYEEKYLVADSIIIPIQVNGKRRGEVRIISQELGIKEEVEEKARAVIAQYLEEQKIKKVVYVPGKIINFVL